MKKTVIIAALAAPFLIPSPALGGPSEGKPIPAFSLKGTDGATYDTKTIASKPTVLVFLANGCPHNKKAVLDWNKIAATLKGKVRVVGVLNTDLGTAKVYAKELKFEFPLLADKDFKGIEAFGAKHSLDHAFVRSSDKRWAKSWEGYSAATLRELFAEIAAGGVTKVKLDFGSFPAKKQSGCSL